MNHKGLRIIKIGKGWSEREGGIERNTLDLVSWVEAVCLDVGCFSS